MKWIFTAVLMVGLTGAGGTMAQQAPVSEDTQACLECHKTLHPGIVEGWKLSRHSRITPREAMEVSGLARKVSSQTVPEYLRGNVLGCAECHTLQPETHADTFSHNGYEVHTVVTPKDCSVCHSQEAEQFDRNLMAHARGNLLGNDVFKILMQSINGSPALEKGALQIGEANAATQAESCLYCHGTELKVTGTETRDSVFGQFQVPVIDGWPNQGTGRINPDGSRGACSACHTRHRFSIEMARKPYTCKECHVGPDVPAFKVYAASKHGNIFSSHQQEWDFTPVPWTIGEDFKAPTCATCHISLLVNSDGEMVVQRTHEVKDRLPYRIFGLIYAHPHPKDPDTTKIKNKDGLQLPTDFGGGYVMDYLKNEEERDQAKKAIQAACLNCHGTGWVEGHWARFENTLKETNQSTRVATQIMADIWGRGYARGLDAGDSPFDEYIEKQWSNTWLFYANSVRFASAMAGGGDYGVFAQGRYHLSMSVRRLMDWLRFQKKIQ
jgi:hypothetical protein